MVYRDTGVLLVVSATTLWAIIQARFGTGHLSKSVSASYAIFLILSPGFGLQYFTLLIPLVLAGSIAWGGIIGFFCLSCNLCGLLLGARAWTSPSNVQLCHNWMEHARRAGVVGLAVYLCYTFVGVHRSHQKRPKYGRVKKI